MAAIRQAFAYITREHQGQREVLVFTHRDFPEASVQVPKGTVEPEETPEQAVVREVYEESGLTGCRLLGKIASDQWIFEGVAYARFFFHLTCDGAPDAWDHTVTGQGEDTNLVFQYCWTSDRTLLPRVWGHGDYLDRVL